MLLPLFRNWEVETKQVNYFGAILNWDFWDAYEKGYRCNILVEDPLALNLSPH